MDLTPIIYSSMLVVFSLLSLVIIVSFVCSKMSFCAGNKNKQVRGEYNNIVSDVVLPTSYINPSEKLVETQPNAFIEVEEAPTYFALPKVEEEEYVHNIVNDISNPEVSNQDIMQSDYVTSVSRYSIVNSLTRNESYSKMSVQYS
ncbi:MAG: hypothetical protein L3J41_10530 [Melioribacteraceae bacterium]|nr:hypothetical protein [Melioribacteraceae bacterium]